SLPPRPPPPLPSFPTRRSSDLYDITSPTAASFYVFPEAQGFGTRAEVTAAVGASPSLAPEVANLIITGPTPSATTIANVPPAGSDRKSTRLNSSHVKISYAVFC